MWWLNRLVPLTIYFEGDDGGGTGGGADGGGADGGGGPADWTANLPETVRSWDEVQNSDSPDKFWDQMSNMRSLIGQSIRVPSENAGKEDMDKFYQRLQEKVPGLIPAPNIEDPDSVSAVMKALGHPDAPDGYKIPEMETGGVELDFSTVEVFRPIAHKAGITQKQWDIIVSEMTAANLKEFQNRRAGLEQSVKELQTEWGAAYDANYEVAQMVAKVTDAPNSLLEALDKKVADPGTVKWLYKVAAQLGGDEKVKLALDKNDKDGKLTPKEAKTRINEILGNKEHPYWDKQHPSNKDAIELMLELQRLANPEPKHSGNNAMDLMHIRTLRGTG